MICFLCLLDESIELDKRIRAAVRTKVLLRRVDICKFRGQVGKVGKSEFSWIGDVTDAEKAYRILDSVAGRLGLAV